MEKEAKQTFRAALARAVERLIPISSTPRLDVELLLAQASGISRLQVVINPSSVLSEEAAHRFWSLVERREAGEPIAYLRGVQEFWGIEFRVNPSVLIPRPETELLVEEVLKYVSHLPDPLTLADCGTGSGCIAVSLALELQKQGRTFSITAIDKSEAALATARANASTHHVDSSITFILSEWFSNVPPTQQYDLVVSNPPYIPHGDPHVSRETFFEPAIALYAENQGLADIEVLLSSLRERLIPRGAFFCEFGSGQQQQLAELTATLGDARFISDLAGIPRVLHLQRS